MFFQIALTAEAANAVPAVKRPEGRAEPREIAENEPSVFHIQILLLLNSKFSILTSLPRYYTISLLRYQTKSLKTANSDRINRIDMDFGSPLPAPLAMLRAGCGFSPFLATESTEDTEKIDEREATNSYQESMYITFIL